MVEAMQRDLHAQFGGGAGVRDRGLLESALARARQLHAYEADADLASLAAAYGFGVARNHPFVDANKRTALMAMYTFLAINGVELDAPEAEAVRMMLDLAAGKLTETELADWLRRNSA